ncbi:MAG: NAD-dependent epimerase/dehydratase family protein [Nannocystaceae bacterium]
MRIFITGASGFAGGRIAERLAAAGHEVAAMARSEGSAARVAERGATAVRCALGAVDPADLAGVDAIVHAAAKVEDWGEPADFWRANVDGTRQLVDAAQAAGVRRFIHIGTEAVLFAGDDLVDVDETRPFPPRHRFPYSETKAAAERLVLAANSPAMTTIALRPRLIWGPGDATVLPELVKMAEAGAYVWLDGGRHRTSTCHVDNLAAAVERALVSGRGGEAYFIADDVTSTHRDFLSRLAATRGVDLGRRSLPGALVRPLAGGVEGLWRVLRRGRKPPLTRFAISMLSRTVTVSTAKAEAELGYRPVVTVDAGLAALRGGSAAASGGAAHSQA